MLRIFPDLRILSAIPSDVGPNAAPVAIAPLADNPRMKAIAIPIAIGSIEPTKAIMIPRAPIIFNVARSISIPASMTKRINLKIFR